jgi:hypothetical protein
MAAGLVAAAALALAVVISSAPGCKTSWGNAACLPLKSQARTAPKALITPKPRPEPGGAKAASSATVAVRGQARPKSPAAVRRAAMARATHARRGPVGNLGPAPGRSGWHDFPCGEACRYRAWFNRYAAWYYAYGRYDAAPGAEARAQEGPIRRDMPQEDSMPNPARAQNDRARLDPWHGYDFRDGLENGY